MNVVGRPASPHRASRTFAVFAPINHLARRAGNKLTDVLGGPARRRVVVLLASVLAMDSADKGAVGALAPQLERQFHIGNAELGLLVTVSSLVGLLVTLPMGMLADRISRVRLLTGAIVTWAAATVMTGLSTSYEMLLASRLALGVLIAAAGPAVASLTGDFFAASERGRIYGYILTGELLGSGAGLLIAGNVGAATNWRIGFFVMAVPSIGLAIAVAKLLPEPGRGGQGQLRADDDGAVQAGNSAEVREEEKDELKDRVISDARRHGFDRHSPRPPSHPERISIWAAARYVLSVPSNRVFIAASGLGYFFLGGVRSFAVIFAKGHFGISQAEVSLFLIFIGGGAVLGTLCGGRIADRLIRGGRTDGRVIVAGVSFLVASVLFIPGLINQAVLVSLPLFVLAAAFFAAPNPPLDSARLDVMPSALWGRAESVRTFVRTSFESFAPLLFGFVSELFGAASVGFGAGVNNSHAKVTAQNAHGIELTFLVMLAPLALSGVLLLRNRRAYLADVAATLRR
jgi:predicted MFS family arabinose efflux permease